MPPRNRQTAQRAATTDPQTDPAVVDDSTAPTENATTENASPTENGNRTYSRRTTDADTGLSGGFSVAKAAEVPAVVRDRGRTNQFDAPVLQSYQQDFASEEKHGKGGAWVSGHVVNLEAAEKQARNAATHMGDLHELPIGIEIRKHPDDASKPDGAGTIYFRGKLKRDKAPAATDKAPAATK